MNYSSSHIKARDGREPSMLGFGSPCSGSNKSKGWVRFDFFTSADNLGSVRVRFLYSHFTNKFASVLLYISTHCLTVFAVRCYA